MKITSRKLEDRHVSLEAGRNLLHLSCRHRLMEIMIENSYSVMKIAPSTGPNILIFNRFRDYWSRIDSRRFETAVDLVGL